LSLLCILLVCYIALVSTQLQPLVIFSAPGTPTDQRYLALENGKPFFWTGDTPWELFSQLNVDDVNYYLNDRAQKNYNILQVVGVWDLEAPNKFGDYAFNPQLDPTHPNEKYWAYVDQVLDLATQKGFYIAMWPVWGSMWVSWGAGHNPPKKQVYDTQNSYIFGQFIGNRLRNRKNIVWVLGGDVFLPVYPAEQIDCYRSMAEGIAQGVVGGHRPLWNDTTDPAWKKLLISFHPTSPQTSSAEFESDAWLSFNLVQSGWRNWEDILPLIHHDYNLSPKHPTFMGEGAYEWDIYTYCNMPNNTNDQWGVRFNTYWSVFAGSFGTTYGAYGIFQFSSDWKQDLQYPGASQIQYVRKLYEAHDWTKLIPDMDNTFVPKSASGNSTDCALVIGTIAYDGSFGFVYNTKGIVFQVNLAKLSSKVTAQWYNPRNGAYTSIGQFNNNGLQQFTPSGTPGNENDWVLVLTTGNAK